MARPVIVAAKRTAIGTYGGTLKGIGAVQLGRCNGYHNGYRRRQSK